MNHLTFTLHELDNSHGTFLNLYNKSEKVILEKELILPETKKNDLVLFSDYSFTKYIILENK